MYGPTIPANVAGYGQAPAGLCGRMDVGACSLGQLAARVRVGGKVTAHVMARNAERAKCHAICGVEGLRSWPIAGRHALWAMGRTRRSERPQYSFDLESSGVMHRSVSRRTVQDGRMPSLGRILWPRPSGTAPCRTVPAIAWAVWGRRPGQPGLRPCRPSIVASLLGCLQARWWNGCPYDGACYGRGYDHVYARTCPGACHIPGIADGCPEAQFPARSGSPDDAIHMARDHNNCARTMLRKPQAITPARSDVTQSNTFDMECKQLHYALK